MNVDAALAGSVVVLHLLFVLFAVAGGVLALRWPRIAWVHLPAAAWAAIIEFSGGICPLTPLENTLRRRAGLEAYSGDFIATYVFPALYPEALTRDVQVMLGAVVVALNVVVYAVVVRQKRSLFRDQRG